MRIISVPVTATSKFKKAIESSWNALSLRCRQISPKANGLGVRGHERSKTALLSESFSVITSVFEMIEQWFWHHRVCLVKTHRNMYSMTLKGQGQNLTSGQGHVVTQVGHIAYVSMRLDERNTMRPLSRLYLIWIKSYSQKSVGDLRWPQMTFGGSPMKTVAWVITEDLSQHYSQWMKMFWCEKEVVEILPIDNRQVTKLTWPQVTNMKNPRYTNYSNYWPHQLLKV